MLLVTGSMWEGGGGASCEVSPARWRWAQTNPYPCLPPFWGCSLWGWGEPWPLPPHPGRQRPQHPPWEHAVLWLGTATPQGPGRCCGSGPQLTVRKIQKLLAWGTLPGSQQHARFLASSSCPCAEGPVDEAPGRPPETGAVPAATTTVVRSGRKLLEGRPTSVGAAAAHAAREGQAAQGSPRTLSQRITTHARVWRHAGRRPRVTPGLALLPQPLPCSAHLLGPRPALPSPTPSVLSSLNGFV